MDFRGQAEERNEGKLIEAHGRVPWEKLRKRAQAINDDPSECEELMDLLTGTYAEPDYLQLLHTLGALDLARPGMEDSIQKQVGRTLLNLLVGAGAHDDSLIDPDVTLVCGKIGPVLLEDVVTTIEGQNVQPDESYSLWMLTRLAVESNDPELRDKTAALCVGALEGALAEEYDCFYAVPAAGTLAGLDRSRARPLVQQVYEFIPMDAPGYVDLESILRYMESDQAECSWAVPTDVPVEEWLPESMERADLVTGALEDKPETTEELADHLARRFYYSLSGAKLARHIREEAQFIIHSLIHAAWEQLRVSVGEMTGRDVCEILLEIFPRKVTAREFTFERIVPVLRVFFPWLERESYIENAARLVEAVEENSDVVVEYGMDPGRWGMGKTVGMMALKEGVDMTDEQEREEFIARFNASLGTGGTGIPAPPPTPGGAGAPMLSSSRDVGRNDPCPCGSGRKYKKCCGHHSRGR
ncbi:MAG: YecA family protein [Candidatus Brocadiia bacterium]